MMLDASFVARSSFAAHSQPEMDLSTAFPAWPAARKRESNGCGSIAAVYCSRGVRDASSRACAVRSLCAFVVLIAVCTHLNAIRLNSAATAQPQYTRWWFPLTSAELPTVVLYC